MRDQNRPSATAASISLVLVFAAKNNAISVPVHCDRHRDIDPATVEFPASVREKRVRLRRLLGTLGHHLLAATDWLVSIRGHRLPKRYFRGKHRVERAETY